MKTHTIKTAKAELLIVEMSELGGYNLNKNRIAFYDNSKKERLHIKGNYTLLGKPDEISEEDVKQIISTENYVFNNQICSAYIFHGNQKKCYTESAKKSLLSLLESEIYWENPFGNRNPVYDLDFPYLSDAQQVRNEQWHEAEQKTFDRKRSLIFKKNK